MSIGKPAKSNRSNKIPGALTGSHGAGRLQRAIAQHRNGQLDEAEQEYLSSLAEKPQIFDALHLLGLIHLSRKQHQHSIALIRSALAIHPGNAVAHGNLGNALLESRRIDEAIASYRTALACQPDYVEAHNNLGNALKARQQFEEAIASYRKALEIKPDYATAYNNMGSALQELKRLEEAVASYRKAVALRPGYAEAHYNLGKALQELRQQEDAIICYRKALELKPDYVLALTNLGSILQERKQHEEAIACYRNALALNPGYAVAYSNLGNSLRDLKRLDEAIACYRKALQIDPGYADAYDNLGSAYQDLRNFDEAIGCYRKALEYNPQHPHAFAMLADSELKICDWRQIAGHARNLSIHVRQRKSIVSPFTLLGFTHSPEEQLWCAQKYIRDHFPRPPQPLWNGERYVHEKIRIAYLSADFHQHATAYLMAELFELHDKDRFEVIGISFGPDDRSEIRGRLAAAFDRFHDVRSISDAAIAKLVKDLEVDIAIDLKGFTQNARPGIFVHRPAPVQVNYLGYPGTMGADFIDYVIADQWVTPFDQQANFSEKIVHLPDCYQVNDRKRVISPDTPTRMECGLPEQGFVFCCFNGSYKITPEVFDVWMSVLQQIDGSVLWLLRDNETAERNLKWEAQTCGIDPARLVFAPRRRLEDHLARYRVADLFLDTLPINAHTTASDALWAGLPVLTCTGSTFAGRVAGSLLHAVGLPELVTEDLEQYEALALQLAGDPVLLGQLRTRLEANRAVSPLFDAARTCRHLEEAYRIMRELARQGQPPASFAVD